MRPSRLLLWLDDARLMQELPNPLKRLQRRGLEVRLSRNYGPHTKYYPYILDLKNFTEPLVTADDDIIYPTYWLEELSLANVTMPSLIHCFRARTVLASSGALLPFNTWPFCTETTPDIGRFFEGVSGVIYPPAFLDHLKLAGDAFLGLCPKHDDAWLNVNAVRAGFRVRQLRTEAKIFNFVPNTQADGLWVANLSSYGDEQLSKTFTWRDIHSIQTKGSIAQSPAAPQA